MKIPQTVVIKRENPGDLENAPKISRKTARVRDYAKCDNMALTQ